MKLLVIGSEGFIGGSLLRYFHALGEEVMGVDINPALSPLPYPTRQVLSLNYSLDKIIEPFVPDVCVFAGGSASVQLSIQQPGLDFDANVAALSSLMDALLRINSSCRVLHISSAAVYGNPLQLPVPEDTKLQPLSPYGWHKMMAEMVCREFFSCFQMPSCSVRPFSVYGEGQKKLLFWDLYQRWCKGLNTPLYGTGEETRDFIHISDLVRALELIIRKGDFNGGVYNIASGKETTIREATNTFYGIAGTPETPPFSKNNREGDPLRWQADITRISLLGFKATVDLETGLKQYFKWLKENA